MSAQSSSLHISSTKFDAPQHLAHLQHVYLIFYGMQGLCTKFHVCESL